VSVIYLSCMSPYQL